MKIWEDAGKELWMIENDMSKLLISCDTIFNL